MRTNDGGDFCRNENAVKQKNKKLPRIISGVVFLSLIVCQGCSNKSDELEQLLARELIQHKLDSVPLIDLRGIFGTQWRKICLQHPYMHKSSFEKLAGESVQGFRYISDDRYLLWVFYINGQTTSVAIERMKTMDYRGNGTSCTSAQHPYLYFDIINGEKKYFLMTGGK
ncbi:MAG: hypothetical protein PHU06_10310 [Gallionella sp.]|nr:hypothetical protein [Gallionella sp.]MDD4958923.1 hypothetical protein [Gallionella sp.]